MSHGQSTHPSRKQREGFLQTHYVFYDSISGYIHKFRLEGSQDATPRDDASEVSRRANAPLVVAAWIAASLIVLIGALSL